MRNVYTRLLLQIAGAKVASSTSTGFPAGRSSRCWNRGGNFHWISFLHRAIRRSLRFTRVTKALRSAHPSL